MSILELIANELHRLASLSPEMAHACGPLIARVQTPPRIVIVGRIKAGKSTLLNALVGAPVAETRALEATNVVTVFQNGMPDRAVAYLRSGEQVPIPIQRGRVSQLPAPAAEIAFIDRWLPSQAVSRYTLIDTPGTATLTAENEATTRAALIDGYEQTRSASVDADAAVFLFDSAPRRDEVEFIQQLGFTPLNTLGVLSRADSFGEGALGDEDPIMKAHEHAARLSQQLGGFVSRVMPVSALLAQTVATGVVSESLTREIAAVTSQSRLELVSALYSKGTKGPGGPRNIDASFSAHSLQAAPDPNRHAAHRIENVVDLIGEYGLFRGHEEAVKGGTAFNDWLIRASGIGAIREALERDLSWYAYLHRAGEILTDLEGLVYRHPAFTEPIRHTLHTLRNHPVAIPAKLLITLKSLLAAHASEEFIHEAARLAHAGPPPSRLDLPPNANPWTVLDRIRERRSQMQMLSFGLLDPSEEEAMVVFNQAYDQMERDTQALT